MSTVAALIESFRAAVNSHDIHKWMACWENKDSDIALFPGQPIAEYKGVVGIATWAAFDTSHHIFVEAINEPKIEGNKYTARYRVRHDLFCGFGLEYVTGDLELHASAASLAAGQPKLTYFRYAVDASWLQQIGAAVAKQQAEQAQPKAFSKQDALVSTAYLAFHAAVNAHDQQAWRQAWSGRDDDLVLFPGQQDSEYKGAAGIAAWAKKDSGLNVHVTSLNEYTVQGTQLTGRFRVRCSEFDMLGVDSVTGTLNVRVTRESLDAGQPKFNYFRYDLDQQSIQTIGAAVAKLQAAQAQRSG